MSIKGRDKEFRTPKTTYVDFKHIEMDRVLTMLCQPTPAPWRRSDR